MSKSLLYSRSYSISDDITLYIPTLREILQDEELYNSLIASFVSTPHDAMVVLDDIGIDFSTIDDYELFCLMFPSLQKSDTSILFKNIDFNSFECKMDNKAKSLYFINDDNIIINRESYYKIAQWLRKINFLERNNKKPANKEAKEYMIERARVKLKRAKRKGFQSQLEDLIIALVNTEQYKYNYEESLDLTIYQFKASMHQIIKKINFDNTMIGCYAGTVNIEKIDQNDLNWLLQKH